VVLWRLYCFATVPVAKKKKKEWVNGNEGGKVKNWPCTEITWHYGGNGGNIPLLAVWSVPAVTTTATEISRPVTAPHPGYVPAVWIVLSVIIFLNFLKKNTYYAQENWTQKMKAVFILRSQQLLQRAGRLADLQNLKCIEKSNCCYFWHVPGSSGICDW